MTLPGRVFIDVSYTRTQVGNVGITRTVRRLLHGLESLLRAEQVEFAAVAHHSSGFRLVQSTGAANGSGDYTSGDWIAALWRLLHGGRIRRVVTACIPGKLLIWAWRTHSAWTFDRLSAGELPVAFRPGDLLLLCDESWNYCAWTSAEQARRQGATVVLVCYDLIPIRHPQFCAALFTAVFRDWLVRILTSCQAVLCISKATQADLLLFCDQMRITAPTTAHFRLGCDLPATAARPVRSQLADFLAGSEPCFATIGTIEPRKNHAMLLSVFEQLWFEGSNVRLLVAGRPHSESGDIVHRLSTHPEHGRRLLVLFDASDEEISLAYSSSQALVLASQAEGFGLPLVEARTRGCPVIASDLPALAELADDGVCLFAAGSMQALKDLILQHARDDRRARVAPMDPFTWHDSARQCLQAISRMSQAAAPVRAPLQHIRTGR
jgi:glycosyltransferase involved in cell wall biosynthesis